MFKKFLVIVMMFIGTTSVVSVSAAADVKSPFAEVLGTQNNEETAQQAPNNDAPEDPSVALPANVNPALIPN